MEGKSPQTEIQRVIESSLPASKDMQQFALTLANVPVPLKLVGKVFFGLFLPPPQWPPQKLTVGLVLLRGIRGGIFCLMLLLPALSMLSISILLLPALMPFILLAIPIILAMWVYRKISPELLEDSASAKDSMEDVGDWHTDHERYFSTKTPAAQRRRKEVAQNLIDSVSPEKATRFNQHIASATGLAVYGCGVLASSHVGGLAALEKHGLRYEKLSTLAGVSAGAVVVAMIALGYRAEELHELVQTLPFPQFARPELGALLRSAGSALYHSLLRLGYSRAAAFSAPFAGGHGPGMNTGGLLLKLVGEAIQKKCGDEDITLGQVEKRYGKRLVIIVTELDSGRELRLTPECHPNLPLKVAVRMSMGVPGLMEPFYYNGHVYCDGGMMNDFPMDALPEVGRLGLMVRPVEWVAYNSELLSEVVPAAELEDVPCLKETFEAMSNRLQRRGVYPVESPLDFMSTCIQVMMDANLMLQIKATTELDAANREASQLWQKLQATANSVSSNVKSFVSKASSSLSETSASASLLGTQTSASAVADAHNAQVTHGEPADGERASVNGATANGQMPAAMGLSKLAPQILMLCCGELNSFDFALTPDQHLDLYYMGQLCVHMHAAQLEGQQRAPQVMSNQAKLKLILLLMHLKPPA